MPRILDSSHAVSTSAVNHSVRVPLYERVGRPLPRGSSLSNTVRIFYTALVDGNPVRISERGLCIRKLELRDRQAAIEF